jgi:hypothetical protein
LRHFLVSVCSRLLKIADARIEITSSIKLEGPSALLTCGSKQAALNLLDGINRQRYDGGTAGPISIHDNSLF